MAIERKEGEILGAILRYKLDMPRRDVWVNARDLVPHLKRSAEDIGQTLRLLQMQELVELAPQMYGSSKDPTQQRYGLTASGAGEAKYFDAMRFDFNRMRNDVLLHLFHKQSKEGIAITTAQELAEVFREDAGELVQVINTLEGDGLLKFFGGMGMPPQEMLYQLTPDGHRVASYIQREGRFPPHFPFASAPNINTNFHGPVGVAAVGNSGPVTINYAPGVNGEAFAQALRTFQEALQGVDDPDEREEGEMRVSHLRRAVEQGNPGETQFQRLTAWLAQTGQGITGTAVLWNGAAAIGNALGLSLPSAPEGLGQ